MMEQKSEQRLSPPPDELPDVDDMPERPEIPEIVPIIVSLIIQGGYSPFASLTPSLRGVVV